MMCRSSSSRVKCRGFVAVCVHTSLASQPVSIASMQEGMNVKNEGVVLHADVG